MQLMQHDITVDYQPLLTHPGQQSSLSVCRPTLPSPHRSCVSAPCSAQTFAQPMDVANTMVAEPLTPQQARKEWKPLTPEDLVSVTVDPEQYKLPAGYHWYETMIVLRAMMDDQGR